MKFRKKPVVIEAIRWNGLQFDGAALWILEGMNKGPGEIGSVRKASDNTVLISTLEGTMIANPGDWIIRGVAGELYPCKPDIFAATYSEEIASAEPTAPTDADVLHHQIRERRLRFRADLETLVNRHSMENGSDTPDFILADYMVRSLEAFEATTADREKWYGRPKGLHVTTDEAAEILPDGRPAPTPAT